MPDTPEAMRARAVEIVYDHMGDGLQHELRARAANIVRELIDAGMMTPLDPTRRLHSEIERDRNERGIDARRGRTVEDRLAVLEARADDLDHVVELIAQAVKR